jgi:hypothetical protein
MLCWYHLTTETRIPLFVSRSPGLFSLYSILDTHCIIVAVSIAADLHRQFNCSLTWYLSGTECAPNVTIIIDSEVSVSRVDSLLPTTPLLTPSNTFRLFNLTHEAEN